MSGSTQCPHSDIAWHHHVVPMIAEDEEPSKEWGFLVTRTVG